MAPDTDYPFRVTAVGGGLESDPTSSASVHTPGSLVFTSTWENLSTVHTPQWTTDGVAPPIQYFSDSPDPRYDYRVAYVQGGNVVAHYNPEPWAANGRVFNEAGAVLKEGGRTIFGTMTDLQNSIAAGGGLYFPLTRGTWNHLGISFADAPYYDNDPSSPGIDWQLQRMVRRTPSVSIAPSNEEGTDEAWEVPLNGSQDKTLKFTVSRTGSYSNGDLNQPLTVQLHPPAGTAVSGDDYTGMPSSVTIPAYQSIANFTMTAKSDNVFETDETLTLCLKADSSYRLAGYTASGTIHDKPSVNLSINANNDGTIDAADDVEQSTSSPGALIAVNDDDDNRNGIPDFAETSWGNNTVSGDSFELIKFTVPAEIDLNIASFGFEYSADDPKYTVRNGDGSYRNEYIYKGLNKLRLWTEDGNILRSGEQIDAGGDFLLEPVTHF